MRSKISLMALGALAIVGVGCSGDPPAPPRPTKELKIVKLDPNAIFIEGGEVLTLETENGCAKDKMTIKVGSVPITVINSTAANKYSFTAPASPNPAAPQTVAVTVTCSETSDPTYDFAAGKNTAEISLTFNPELEPQPVIKNFAPQTQSAAQDTPGNISVLAKMVVTFSRAIAKDTVTDQSFKIEGITGTYKFSDGDDTAGYKTVELTPNAQLSYDKIYNCVVTNSVKSKMKGKALKPGVTPKATADADKWEFKTRCAGCNDPWRGDISAAAGISTGGGYTLFSVTGQPSPVGEASNGTYTLQSGFIYSVQPGAGQ